MEKNCKTCGGTGWVMRPSIPTSCPEGCEPKMYPADTVVSKGDLHQCPYDKATRCNLKDPCLGCETWAASRTSAAEKPMTAEEAQRCPVCGGNGLVPNGFYNTVTGIGSTTSITPETCRSCNGTGIVFPYASLKPTVEVSDGDVLVDFYRYASEHIRYSHAKHSIEQIAEFYLKSKSI